MIWKIKKNLYNYLIENEMYNIIYQNEELNDINIDNLYDNEENKKFQNYNVIFI